MNEGAVRDNPLAALRRFRSDRPAIEACDFCGARLCEPHQHLLEPEKRRLVCVCDACAILFGNQGETKYKRVPRRTCFLRDFQMTETQWQSLLIPIRLAFIFHDSATQKSVALYPSPAGPVESWLDTTAWTEIEALNPALRKMEHDVEALLVRRTSPGGSDEYYLAPIDECFRLAGILRSQWRGLSGGELVWEEIERFFLELKTRAIVSEEK
jgi:Family of unknown function (DUF5947)